MEKQTPRSKRRLVVGAVIAGALVLMSGVAVASDTGSGNVIHGCVDEHGGQLRVLSGHDTRCGRHESPISWNQRGPTGPQGVQGVPGAPAAGVHGSTWHADIDVPVVAAQSCVSYPIVIPGRDASDHVLVNPTDNLPLGIVVMGIFDVNPPDIEPFTQMRVCNITAAPIDPPYGDWGFVLFRDQPSFH